MRLERYVQLLSDGFHEVHCVQIVAFLDILDAVNAAGEIFGHFARIHRFDASTLESARELLQILVTVEFGAMLEAARPSEDRGNRVRAG